jgi:hypothetical protein
MVNIQVLAEKYRLMETSQTLGDGLMNQNML